MKPSWTITWNTGTTAEAEVDTAYPAEYEPEEDTGRNSVTPSIIPGSAAQKDLDRRSSDPLVTSKRHEARRL